MLLAKTKLDLLMHSYDAAMSALGFKAAPTHHAHHHMLLESDVIGGSPHCRDFGYASLQDWNLLSQRLLQKRFREWEGRFLSEAREILLPIAARAVASCSSAVTSRRHRQDHSAVSVLQAVYAAAGLTTYPAFLNMETMLQQ